MNTRGSRGVNDMDDEGEKTSNGRGHLNGSSSNGGYGGGRGARDSERPGKTEKSLLKDSRKFKVLCLACAVYIIPVLLMFALAMAKQASKDDVLSLAKWMGASLSPAFMAYIGGVALEDASSKRANGG